MSTHYAQGLPEELWIAANRIPGREQISKYGRIELAGTANTSPINPVDIWVGGGGVVADGAGVYPGFPPVDEIGRVRVTSLSALDTILGIGMRTIIIIGIGEDFMPQWEVLDMNGIAGTPSQKKWYRIYRAAGLTGGREDALFGANEDIVTIAHDQGAKTVFAIIAAHYNQTEQAVFTPAVNQTGMLAARTLSATSGAGSAKGVKVVWATREFQSGLWSLKNQINPSTDQPPFVAGRYSGVVKAKPLSDVVMRVVDGDANGLSMTAEFDINIIDPTDEEKVELPA